MVESPAKSAEVAARLAHDLGLAACFGGTLFGKVAFNASLPAIGSKTARGRLGRRAVSFQIVSGALREPYLSGY